MSHLMEGDVVDTNASERRVATKGQVKAITMGQLQRRFKLLDISLSNQQSIALRYYLDPTDSGLLSLEKLRQLVLDLLA